MSGSCRDLRSFQESDAVADAFAKLISGGRPGYKTIIEKDKPVPTCQNQLCRLKLTGDEKFCPECGTKTNFK
jgi:hypothetical protein